MSNTAEAVLPQASIMDRQEIEAPVGYASVFHETTAEALPNIDVHGLQVASESNMSDGVVNRKNVLMDQDRPQRFIDAGVSRVSSLYAYPFLHEGHGLYGADQRYIKRERAELENEYQTFRKYGSKILATMGVSSASEYAGRMQDPDYLREQYPDGEILELKVDPARCFVGDLTEVTDMFQSMDRRWYETGDAKTYWEGLITLADFLKWYKKAEYAEDGDSIKEVDSFRDGDQVWPGRYCPIAGAPDGMPYSIMQPEILVPDAVPQEHIRLVH